MATSVKDIKNFALNYIEYIHDFDRNNYKDDVLKLIKYNPKDGSYDNSNIRSNILNMLLDKPNPTKIKNLYWCFKPLELGGPLQRIILYKGFKALQNASNLYISLFNTSNGTYKSEEDLINKFLFIKEEIKEPVSNENENNNEKEDRKEVVSVNGSSKYKKSWNNIYELISDSSSQKLSKVGDKDWYLLMLNSEFTKKLPNLIEFLSNIKGENKSLAKKQKNEIDKNSIQYKYDEVSKEIKDSVINILSLIYGKKVTRPNSFPKSEIAFINSKINSILENYIDHEKESNTSQTQSMSSNIG